MDFRTYYLYKALNKVREAEAALKADMPVDAIVKVADAIKRARTTYARLTREIEGCVSVQDILLAYDKLHDASLDALDYVAKNYPDKVGLDEVIAAANKVRKTGQKCSAVCAAVDKWRKEYDT
jgi:hypothetical protein